MLSNYISLIRISKKLRDFSKLWNISLMGDLALRFDVKKCDNAKESPANCLQFSYQKNRDRVKKIKRNRRATSMSIKA